MSRLVVLAASLATIAATILTFALYLADAPVKVTVVNTPTVRIEPPPAKTGAKTAGTSLTVRADRQSLRRNSADTPSRYLAADVQPITGGASPWAVLLYGTPNANELAGKTVESLRSQGRDTVNLFRSADAEQAVAPALFGGNTSLGAQLHLGTYCTRVLVGRLTTASEPPTDGLAVAQAKITFRLLTPDGNIVREAEFSEKEGGGYESQAVSRAIDSLRASLPDKLNAFLQ